MTSDADATHSALFDRYFDLVYGLALRLMGERVPVEDEPEYGPALTRGTNDPEHDALAAERRPLVLEALNRLPEALRIPVVLHDYERHSHEEIADVLGIEHAAARKRYSRALTALAGILSATLGETRAGT